MNYEVEMTKILEEMKTRQVTPTLLLQSCCAPCSSYVLERLTPYFHITIFYYNPNIEPKEEYEKRKEEEKQFIAKLKSPNRLDMIDCDYDNEIFHDVVTGLENELEGGARCFRCYDLRLRATAKKAKELGYDYFATTLTVSPYKNAMKLNEIGKDLEKEYGVSYLPSDFKKKNGYLRSIELSKEYGLYRQDYCGCIYSKKNKCQE